MNVCDECDVVGGGDGGGKKAEHQKINGVIRDIRIELL